MAQQPSDWHILLLSKVHDRIATLVGKQRQMGSVRDVPEPDSAHQREGSQSNWRFVTIRSAYTIGSCNIRNSIAVQCSSSGSNDNAVSYVLDMWLSWLFHSDPFNLAATG